MEPNTILPDDPRLTAYALNEMEPTERAAFEKLLQPDAAARQAVEEIRAAGTALAAALEHEADTEAVPVKVPVPKPARILRFPQLYFVVSGLAAACFAVVFVLWQSDYQPRQARQLIEVDLAKTKTAETQERGDSVASVLPPAEGTPVVTMDLLQRNEVEAKAVAGIGDQASQKLAKEHASAANAPEGFRAAPAAASRSLVAKSMAVDDKNSRDAKDESVKLDAFVVSAPAAIGGGSAVGNVTGSDQQFSSGAQPAKKPWGPPASGQEESNTEAYAYRKDNGFLRAADQPLSTFSVDVDTASYANVRRFLSEGQRPPADAVRIEEMVNYFPYHYQPPAGGVPFAASLEVASAPWAPEHRLVRIGLKGREVSDAARPAVNLVFLLDVSGSMNAPNKLPLVKQSIRLLVGKLRPDDRVAIAVYAGASGLALPSTPASHQGEILHAIDRLQAGGSTNGAMGIQLAYDIAKANFIAGGVNRVILATDGDFNVGVTSEGGLVRLIEEKAKSGVFLTVLGFGMGNLKDATLEQLADKGNGNYAYIDSLGEAKKALVEQAGGTLVTIAKDVKLQVEFNPLEVQAYRLIGYENRLLAKEDFNDDKVDAGEIGAGHTVTALYEVVPVGVELAVPVSVDALKYQAVSGQQPAVRSAKAGSRKLMAESSSSGEMLTVKIRYKEPAGDVSSKLEFPLRDSGTGFEQATGDFRFAAAVAAFGMALRDSPHRGSASLTDVVTWGRSGLGSDAGGYRNEFIGLVERARQLVE